jgi:hypothetical protein
MFFIRATFWIGLLVLLLPTDERQQQRLYSTAVATVERATTFCDRNAKVCDATSEMWAMFLKKAEFGVRMAIDLAGSGNRAQDEAVPLPAQPTSARPRPEARMEPVRRGTLTPADLTPAWRGPGQRAGT